MYLLDTDVLIWALRGDSLTVDRILGLKAKGTLAISVISIAEIYKNIFPTELTVTEDFLEQHLLLDVTGKVAKVGGLYWQEHHESLSKLSLTDCLIAATAKVNEFAVVTHNVKHFPMSDILVIDPSR